MAFSTPCYTKPDSSILRGVQGLLTAALFAWSGVMAHAQGIHVKSAELVLAESGYILEANYEITLSHTLEEALQRGLALHFVTEFDLTQSRWWTLGLWDRTVAELRQQHRLSYNALTRQFRISFGSLHQNFDSLEDALAVLGRVRQRAGFGKDDVHSGSIYSAALRLRLDTSLLPKPLQIDALGSRDWNLSSEWYRWTFKP
jgi:hypothetical protein